MMKAKPFLILLLIFTLLLPFASLARQQYYTITEVWEQAAHGWQQTYTAHGRTIAVNVMPHVSQVDAVPALQTQRAQLNPQQDMQGRWGVTVRPKDGAVIFEADRKAVVGTRGYTLGNVVYKGYDLNTRYINSNPLTLGQMLAMLQNILETSGLEPSLLYFDQPHAISQLIYQDKRGNKDAEPTLMGINFYQSLKGLPIVGRHHLAYLPKSGWGNVDYHVFEPHPYALILSPTQFTFFLGGMMEETQTLAEDVPLAGFDRVVDTLEKEIKAGRLRQVFNLSFGYALYADKQNKAKPFMGPGSLFYALPVWTVDCIYVGDARTRVRDYSGPDWEDSRTDPYNVFEYKRLLVNAQTGILADPSYQKADRDQYKGFLSWEEAGGR